MLVKGLLLCHTRKCAHRSFHVSVPSSRISETFSLTRLVRFDRHFTLVQNRFNMMSPSVRAHCWENIPAQFCSVSASFITTDAELCSAQNQCDGWVKSCRTKPKQNQTCFCGMPQTLVNYVNYSNMSPKILWKIPISTPFGSKTTEEDEGQWGRDGTAGGRGIWWSEVRCAFWSQLKWGFWQFSRSCFPLRLLFLSGLEKIMRLFGFLLLFPLPRESLEPQFNESLQDLRSLAPGFCLAGNFYCV